MLVVAGSITIPEPERLFLAKPPKIARHSIYIQIQLTAQRPADGLSQFEAPKMNQHAAGEDSGDTSRYSTMADEFGDDDSAS